MSAVMEHDEPVREQRPAFRWEWFYVLILVPWIQDLAQLGEVQANFYELGVKTVLSACIAVCVGMLIRQNRRINDLHHEVERLSITDYERSAEENENFGIDFLMKHAAINDAGGKVELKEEEDEEGDEEGEGKGGSGEKK